MALAVDNKFTLVIDAGHGGHDAGALGSFSKEKDINLNVALAFGKYVERNCPDVKVLYTRKSDVFIPLNERANLANRNKADLFMSIHTNALPEGKVAHGVETYTLGMARAKANLDVAKRENSVILVEDDYKQHYAGFDPNSSESYIMFEFMQDKYMEKSVELARDVQSQVCTSTGRTNKGVHQAGFLVLRCTSMPSCLIELGFITTPEEEQYLNSDKGIDELARGIYQAFLNYRSDEGKVVKHSVAASVAKRERSDAAASKTDEDVSSNSSDDAAPAPAAPARPVTARSTASRTKATADNDSSVDADSSRQIQNKNSEAPVFKVQIIAINRRLRPGSQQFKGETDVDCYEENNMFKYTMGSSTNYNEIYQLRKTLLEKFPQAFIVAFRGDEKMNINQAIREYKSNKNR
jgi:N-acetylmuramoyl-L-alanine amidase